MRVLDEQRGLAVYPGEANRLWHPNAYPRRRFGDRVPVFWQEPERFIEYSAAHRSARDERRLRGTFGAFRALMGGGTLIAKSAMLQFSLPWLCRLFPEARFIHLVRDGRAVVLSYAKRLLSRRAGTGPAPKPDDEGPDDEMLRTLARFWRDSIGAVARASDELGLASEGRMLEVTYESICLDPVAELNRLAAYLEAVAPPSGGGLPASFDNRNWKAAGELSGPLAAELTRIMRDGLDRYDYL